MAGSFFSHLTRGLANAIGSAEEILSAHSSNEISRRKLAQLMEAYYHNNDLYDSLTNALREAAKYGEPLKPLRNPVFRCVEFYAFTIWPGVLPNALPIETDNDALEPVLEKIWQWSNWGSKKQLAVRQFAITGDMFIRVGDNSTNDEPATKVNMKCIKSRYISDFKVNGEGHVIAIRYEVPKLIDNVSKLVTEIWDKHNGMRTWTHDNGAHTDIERLGRPDVHVPFDQLPIDFVPWVYAPFIDMGSEENGGIAPWWNSLDKIDECNRKATRMSDLMFRHNKSSWAAESNMMDANGRPLGAPELEKETLSDDETVMYMPGMSKMTSLIPNINWSAHKAAVDDDLLEIERDLPEIRFFDLLEGGNQSGRALQISMSPAVAKAVEARANAETALIRAHKMAVTIGQRNNIKGFDIGTFDDGALDHSFREREVLPMTEGDRMELVKGYVDMGVPLTVALQRWGQMTEDDAIEIAGEVENSKLLSEQIMESANNITAAAGTVVAGVQDTLSAFNADQFNKAKDSGLISDLVKKRQANKTNGV